LLGLCFTGNRGAAQPLAGSDCLVTLLAPLRIDGALSLRLALLGIQPTFRTESLIGVHFYR
jgi:hypothetical protein